MRVTERRSKMLVAELSPDKQIPQDMLPRRASIVKSGRPNRPDGQDGEGTVATFCYPNDIAPGPDGKSLYVNDVADSSSQGRKLGPARIRKLTIRSQPD